MSFRWLKQNPGSVLFLVASMAGLGCLIWMYQQAVKTQRVVESQLRDQQTRLDALRNLKPYPSKDHINTVRRDVGLVTDLSRTFRELLGKRTIPTPAVKSDIDFAQDMRLKIESLQVLACDGELITPADFKFGFSQYAATLPCKNAEEADKARCLELLAKQLTVVERLTQLMIRHNVTRLNYLHRAEVEPGAGADALNAPIINHEKSIYSVLPFEIEFQASPTSLQKFMNAIVSADWFCTIRSVTITPASNTPDSTFTGSRNLDEEGEGQLRVVMRLDVVEFPSFQPDTNQTRGKH